MEGEWIHTHIPLQSSAETLELDSGATCPPPYAAVQVQGFLSLCCDILLVCGSCSRNGSGQVLWVQPQ